jgi:hypothetical protein
MAEDRNAKSKFTLWLVIPMVLVVLSPILLTAAATFEEIVFGTHFVPALAKAIGVLQPWLDFLHFVGVR